MMERIRFDMPQPAPTNVPPPRGLNCDISKMRPATSQMRHLAERLVAQEKRNSHSSGTPAPAASDVLRKLRPQLANLMGNAGFGALISRALALAKADVPCLREVRVKADGSLEGLAALQAQFAPEEIAESVVAVLARLLELLVAFIGASLTRQLAQEIWPDLSLDDLQTGRPEWLETR